MQNQSEINYRPDVISFLFYRQQMQLIWLVYRSALRKIGGNIHRKTFVTNFKYPLKQTTIYQ